MFAWPLHGLAHQAKSLANNSQICPSQIPAVATCAACDPLLYGLLLGLHAWPPLSLQIPTVSCTAPHLPLTQSMHAPAHARQAPAVLALHSPVHPLLCTRSLRPKTSGQTWHTTGKLSTRWISSTSLLLPCTNSYARAAPLSCTPLPLASLLQLLPPTYKWALLPCMASPFPPAAYSSSLSQ